MINIIKKSAIGTIASFVLAVPAIALAVEDYPFMDEVNSCVAESLTVSAQRTAYLLKRF